MEGPVLFHCAVWKFLSPASSCPLASVILFSGSRAVGRRLARRFVSRRRLLRGAARRRSLCLGPDAKKAVGAERELKDLRPRPGIE